MLAEGEADLISFARAYIANPDLVERIRTGAPLAEAPQEYWYGGDETGYSDWSGMQPQPACPLDLGCGAGPGSHGAAIGWSADADHLLVDKLVHAEPAELAAEPGALDPTEWQLSTLRPDGVDEHHPRVDLVGDAQGLL